MTDHDSVTTMKMLATGGKSYDLENFRWEDANVQDVAHVLSQLCRWGGHTDRFYSVAEHSVIVSQLATLATEDPKIGLWGLLHDASEAYMMDIPRPMKRLFPQYAELEKKISEQVLYGLAGLEGPIPEVIKELDVCVAIAEAMVLLGQPKGWLPGYDPLGATHIACLPPEWARQLFLDRYAELQQRLSK